MQPVGIHHMVQDAILHLISKIMQLNFAPLHILYSMLQDLLQTCELLLFVVNGYITYAIMSSPPQHQMPARQVEQDSH